MALIIGDNEKGHCDERNGNQDQQEYLVPDSAEKQMLQSLQNNSPRQVGSHPAAREKVKVYTSD
jgi:hypothetical protein